MVAASRNSPAARARTLRLRLDQETPFLVKPIVAQPGCSSIQAGRLARGRAPRDTERCVFRGLAACFARPDRLIQELQAFPAMRCCGSDAGGEEFGWKSGAASGREFARIHGRQLGNVATARAGSGICAGGFRARSWWADGAVKELVTKVVAGLSDATCGHYPERFWRPFRRMIFWSLAWTPELSFGADRLLAAHSDEGSAVASRA